MLSEMLDPPPPPPQQSKEEIVLPHYILYHIMTFLRRQDLARCKGVNKTWHLITSDDCFGWIEAFAIDLWKVDDESRGYFWSNHHENTTQIFQKAQKGNIVPFDSVSLEKRDIKGWTHECHTFHRAKDNTKVTGKVAGYTEPCVLPRPHEEGMERFTTRVIETCLAHPKLWRIELRDISALLPTPPVNLSNEYHYSILIEINIRVLEKLVIAKQEIPLLKAIVEIVNEKQHDKSESYLNKISHGPAHIPMKTVTTQQQPIGLAKGFKLYKYQLDAVNWMKSVEEDGEGFEYTYLIPWPKAKAAVLFHHSEKTCVPVTDVQNYIQKINPKGGILADEMGLGKTSEIISLVLAHPGDPSLLDPATLTAQKEEREERKKKATTTEGETVSLSGRPKRAAAMDSDKSNKTDKNKKGEQEDLFRTNATLVLCPSHLQKQWLEEIEKYTRPHLNVIMWNTIRELKTCTYQEIINADIVLFAHQMLDNQNYINIVQAKNVNDVWHAKNPGAVTQPTLNHFYWRRIVVDEAHEYTHGAFKSDYRWYMSGTPFLNTHRVTQRKLLGFLGMPIPDDSYTNRAENSHLMFSYMDIVLNNLYWRNTKESIKHEYELPAVVEDLVQLDLTPIERCVYNVVVYEFGRDKQCEMLCHAGMAYKGWKEAYPDLTNLRANMVKHIKNQLTNSRDNIASNKERIKDYEKKREELRVEIENDKTGNTGMKEQNRNHYLHSINMCKEEITRNEERIKNFDKLAEELNATAPSYYTGASMKKFATFPEAEEEKPNENKNDEKSEEGKGGEEDKKKDEEESDVPEIPWSEILDMNLPQLKEEITKRGIKLNPKHRKADLQKVLKEAVKNKVKAEEQEEEEEPQKGKRKKPAAAAKETTAATKKPKTNKSSQDSDKKRTTQDKINEQNLQKWWVEQHGTKLGNFLFYLKRLWTDNPNAKLLVFSRFSELLNLVADLLDTYDVNYAYAEGNMRNRTKEINSFKKDTTIRIALLNLNNNAAGTNIIEASHVVLLEPFQGVQAEAKSLEEQAIARAHRQGQKRNVTVVRLIARNTVEYSALVRNYGKPGETEELKKIQRTDSLTTALITTPSLQKSASFVSLLEESEKF